MYLILSVSKAAVVGWNSLEVVAHVLNQEEKPQATFISWVKPLFSVSFVALLTFTSTTTLLYLKIVSSHL
jgi:hypothetical protein